MKKRIIALVFALSMLCSLFITAGAVSVSIVDDAELLTPEQEATLSDRIDSIRAEYDFDITFITTDDTMGQTLKTYLDNHAALDTTRDGIVFGQDITAREYHTTGRHYGATVMSDAALERIDEVVAPYLSDGDYYKAYDRYLDELVDFLDAAATGVPYEGAPLGVTDILIAVVVGLVGGAIVAFVVTGSMVSKMNTARKKKEAASYVRQGSFYLAQSHDRFMYENTTRTAKSQEKDDDDNDSRGGSGGGSY